MVSYSKVDQGLISEYLDKKAHQEKYEVDCDYKERFDLLNLKTYNVKFDYEINSMGSKNYLVLEIEDVQNMK